MDNKEITAEAVFTAYEKFLEKISEEGSVEQSSYRQFIEMAHDAYGRPADSGIVRLFAVFTSGFLMGMATRDADIVEAVRCKDCKHYGGITFGGVCRKYSGAETKVCTEKDHFCSYGERRHSND